MPIINPLLSRSGAPDTSSIAGLPQPTLLRSSRTRLVAGETGPRRGRDELAQRGRCLVVRPMTDAVDNAQVEPDETRAQGGRASRNIRLQIGVVLAPDQRQAVLDRRDER